jgi:hypothetical protein
VTPPTEHHGKRHGEKPDCCQSPPGSQRVQGTGERVEPPGPRRRHESDDHCVDVVERAGREVQPDRPRDHDEKEGGQPELAGEADGLRQGRRCSGWPTLPTATRRGHDAGHRSRCLPRRLHVTSPQRDPDTIATSPEPPSSWPSEGEVTTADDRRRRYGWTACRESATPPGQRTPHAGVLMSSTARESTVVGDSERLDEQSPWDASSARGRHSTRPVPRSERPSSRDG